MALPTPVRPQLLELRRRVHERITNCPALTQVVSSTLLGVMGLLYGFFSATDIEFADLAQVTPWLLMLAFGLAGYLGALGLWQHCAGRYYEALCSRVRENLLDRGLLLAALEPVPVMQLLDVFAVPDRERGRRNVLPMPQAPRALNTQRFDTRLHLLLERYPATCKALGLDPWPRRFMELQLDVELGRIWIPVLAVATIAVITVIGERWPQFGRLTGPALMLALLVFRWVLGDVLRALSFAALNGTVVDILTSGRRTAATLAENPDAPAPSRQTAESAATVPRGGSSQTPA